MKWKLLILVALVAVLTGCSIVNPEPKAQFEITSWDQSHYTLEADFEIVDWDQSYYSSLGRYGLVHINYQITNTGTIDIRYYKVWFEVQCADGTTFREWTNGLDIQRWDYETDSTYVDTANKRAVSVYVSDYELTPPFDEEPRGLVRIDYRITNTGPVSIDYYKVWFEVQCVSGRTYRDWTCGALLQKEEFATYFTFVTTGAYSEAVSVSIVDYELSHHSIW
jgi:hypothetical protein